MFALKPIAIEVEKQGGGGGGGRGPEPSREGLVDMLLKAWANSILNNKVAPLNGKIENGDAPLELTEYALLDKLSREFGRVSQSTLAARRVIREHSTVPFVKLLL